MNIGQSDAVTIGEYNEQGELMQGYYYSPQNSLGNAPIAIKHNDNGITQTSYYQNDHLNTPQMLTRPNGAIVWQGQYDAFGEGTQTNTQVSNPIRFPGQYQDDETGLHYNWHRYYDNSIGGYVTRDPIGLDGGINTYGYVGGNPLTRMDPEGLYWAYVLRAGKWVWQWIGKKPKPPKPPKAPKPPKKGTWSCICKLRLAPSDCEAECPPRVAGLGLTKNAAQNAAKNTAPRRCRQYYGHCECRKK